MKPRVDIYSEPNFKGKQQTFNAVGKRQLKESFTQQELIGRTFYLVHPNKVRGKEYALDNGGSNKQGGLFHLYEWSKDNINQIFTMLPNGTIKCMGNSMTMDVIGGNFRNGTRLHLYPQNNSNAQLWTYDSSSKLLKLRNANFVLNIHNYKLANGSIINIWEPNGHESQQWDVRLCEIKNRFAPVDEDTPNSESFAESFDEEFTLSHCEEFEPHLQREEFNTCMVNLFQNGNLSGESSGWVGIGDYNYDPFVTPKGSSPKGTNNRMNQGPRGGPYSTQFGFIGDFKNWVGKKFYIRCRQNRNFVLDTRGFQHNGRGNDQGFISIWQFDPNSVNQIWTIDAFGHLGPASNRRYILGGGASSKQGDWPKMVDNGNSAYNGHRWRLQQNSICHQNSQGVPFLHVAGAVMKNGTRVGYWRDTRARRQGNCTWELQECGWYGNESNGSILNDDLSSGILKPFTDLFLYEGANFRGKVWHFHNGRESDWNIRSFNGFNDTISSYKVRAGAMDNKQTKDNRDTSGNSVCTIRYRVHISGSGWTGWINSGSQAGRNGKYIDAIQFEYTGPGQMYARAHVGNVGWMDWVNSGVTCGVTNGNNSNKRLLQALEFKIDGVSNVFFGLDTFAKGRGWLSRVGLNRVGGTTGQSRPLELIRISASLRQLQAVSNRGRVINLVSIPKKWVVTDMSIGKFQGLIGKPFVIRIRNSSVNRVIDTEGHQNGGGFIKLYDKVADMHANQTWTVDKDGHLISWQNRNSILYIANTRNGTQPTIIGWRGNERKANSTLAKWRLSKDGYIESLANPNQVLDAAAKRFDNNTRITLWSKYNMNNQKFDVIEIGNSSIGKLKDWIGKPFAIQSRGNGRFIIDSAGKQNGGGPVQLWVKGADMHANQTWTTDRDGHLISWKNRNSLLYIDNANNGSRPYFIGWRGNERKVNSNNAKWRLNNDGQFESLASKNQVIDIEGGRYANGTRIVMWGKHTCANQKWNILAVRESVKTSPRLKKNIKPVRSGPVRSGPVRSGPVDIGRFKSMIGKPFYLKSRGNGRFIIDTQGRQNGGGNIVIFEKDEDMSPNQTWTVDAEGRLISWQNRNSILYAQTTGNGAKPVIIGRRGNESKANSKNAKWKLNNNGQIESVAAPNQVLDIEGGRYANGTPILMWSKHNGANQKWDGVVTSVPGTRSDIGEFKNWIGKPFVLKPSKGPNFVVDSRGNHSRANGGAIITGKLADMHPNQTWTVDQNGRITSWANRDAVLCATKLTPGREISFVSAKSSKARENRCKWRLVGGVIENIQHSGFALDVARGSNQAKLTINTRGSSSKWTLSELSQCKYKSKPKIGSLIVAQCTDLIIYGVDTNCKSKPKKITIHNGMRWRPGKSKDKISFKIPDFRKKYGINGVKEIELKMARIDNKQYDKVEDYEGYEEGFSLFKDANGSLSIGKIVGVIVGVLVAMMIGWYLYMKITGKPLLGLRVANGDWLPKLTHTPKTENGVLVGASSMLI